MRRRLSGLLALSVMVTACQAQFGAPDVSNRAKRVTTTATAKPSVKPSTSLLPAAPGAGAGAVAGGGGNVKPTEPTMALKGLLKMDASYVVAAGGGNVVAAGGGNVVAAGGGNVVAAGGGNLIKIGGQVIAAGGGNVVAAGGGNAVAGGGLNFRVLATEVAFGEMLPAKGMVVVPVSLRTGKPLGKAVLTDEEGRYTLDIPESESGNVRVVAAVPGKTADDKVLDDPKLRSELVAPAKQAASAAEMVVDDDRALVSRYFRKAFIGRLMEILDVEQVDAASSDNPLLDAVWKRLAQECVDAGTASMPVAEKQALAERMADNLIYFVDFDSAQVRGVTGWSNTTNETSFEAFTDLMKRLRLAAIARLKDNPAYFDTQPFVVEGNAMAKGEGKPPHVIRKATDLGTFILDRYFSTYGQYDGLIPVFEALGIEKAQRYRVEGADWGMSTAIGLTLVTNPGAMDALIQQIRASKQP